MVDEVQFDRTRNADGVFPPAISDGALLTVEDVARMLNVPVSWVYERTRKRTKERIPGFRLGKYWRFHERDVVAWIERQRVGANPNA
jgi:excisionase family DNA binding protein